MVVKANIVKKQTIGVDLNQKAGGFSAPVQSVNSKTGDVILNANDVGALPDTTFIPSKVSELENDEGFLKSYTESDPTVPAWAKEPTKPKYTAKEVGALSADTEIPSKLSDLKNDSGFLTSVPDEYITETELNEKGYLTGVPSEYVTETELNAKGYLTQHQDLSGYAKKATTLAGYGITDAASKQELNSYGKVKTVNYMTPDANGNINVEGGSGTESNAFELIKGDTLEWNGDTDGRIVVEAFPDDPSYRYIHVSNTVPTMADLQNGGSFMMVHYDNSETEEPFTISDINDVGDYIEEQYGCFFIAKKDGAILADGYDVVLPKAGVYFLQNIGTRGQYVRSLIINNYKGFTKSILKMENLTLHAHDWYGKPTNKGNTLRGDDTVHGGLVKVSNATPTLAEVQKGGTIRMYHVSDNKITGDLIVENYLESPWSVYDIASGNNKGILIASDGLPMVQIKSDGVYFRQDSNICVHSLTIDGYTKFPYNVDKIPAELLPDNIGSGGGVMRVNVTYTGVNESTMQFTGISADKTYQEIYEHIQNGGFVFMCVVIDEDTFLPMMGLTSDSISFGTTVGGAGVYFDVNKSNEWGNTFAIPQ